jgi:Family of unknown function (DUF5675)
MEIFALFCIKMITLTRTEFGPNGIFGRLETSLAQYATLEHAFLSSGGVYMPAITPGIYTCDLYLSPKHQYKVYVFQNVASHSFCELHIGNYNADSDGCVLIGLARLKTMITQSDIAFNRFMHEMGGAKSIQIQVIDAPTSPLTQLGLPDTTESVV